MRPIKERIFHRVFRISRYYAWWILIATLLITGASVYYVRDIPIRSSFLDLLPKNDPLIEEYMQTEEALLQTDYLGLLLTLQKTEGVDPSDREEQLLAGARAITQVFSADPEFLEVSYEQELSPEIPDQYLLLYRLDKEELAGIEASIDRVKGSMAHGDLSHLQLSDLSDVYQQMSETFDQSLYGGDLSVGNEGDLSSIEEVLVQVKIFNSTVLGAIAAIPALPGITEDVQGLSEIFAPGEEAVSRIPQPYFSSDRKHLLITLQPRFPSQRGVAYSTAVMKAVEQNLEQVDPARFGITVGVTGSYAFNAETNSVINADMLLTTIISSVGVLVIFFLAFGSIFYSVIAVIPLLISVVLTMAWAKFAVGGFNLVTSFLPALVLGLGIDYGIHLISRYAEERSRGSSLNRSLYTAVLQKGEASALAAITTSIVFLGLLFSRSRALFDMGVITSMGVIIAFLVTLFLLPALITLFHFLFRFHHRESVINYAPHLASYFRAVTTKGRAILVILLVLTFFIAFQAAQTRFIFSSRDMIPTVKSQQVLNDILAYFGEEGTRIGNYFTFFASSEEELSQVVEHLETSDMVIKIESAKQLLPVNLSEQQQVLNNLNIGSYIDQLDLLDKNLVERASAQAQIRTLLTQFGFLQYVASLNGGVDIALSSNAIQKQLREIHEQLGALDVSAARVEILALRDTLAAFDQHLAQARDLPPVATLLRDILKSLPDGIRSRYLAPSGDYIIQARMTPDIYTAEKMDEFDAFASSFSDKYFGMPLVARQLQDYMKRDFLVSTALATLLIALTLWRSLRGGMRALLAASPLILGYIWMLGGMRLLQIDFNFINITISPLLIGIGVDNGIHIIHRYMEERKIDPEGAVERGGRMTAAAVMVTSLTTMLVFGSLLFARTPGLRILGVSALMGIGFTLIFSLLFLPAALHVEGGKRV